MRPQAELWRHVLDHGACTSLDRVYSSKMTAQVSRRKPSFAKGALTFATRALWPPGQPIFGFEIAGRREPFLRALIALQRSISTSAMMPLRCSSRGLAECPHWYVSSRQLPQQTVNVLRPAEQHHRSSRPITAFRSRLTSCAAAPAVIEMASVSGRMAELKEQGRCSLQFRKPSHLQDL